MKVPGSVWYCLELFIVWKVGRRDAREIASIRGRTPSEETNRVLRVG